MKQALDYLLEIEQRQHDPYQQLWLEVLLQALRDLRSSEFRQGAVRFLLGKNLERVLAMAGIDTELASVIRDFVRTKRQAQTVRRDAQRNIKHA